MADAHDIDSPSDGGGGPSDGPSFAETVMRDVRARETCTASRPGRHRIPQIRSFKIGVRGNVYVPMRWRRWKNSVGEPITAVVHNSFWEPKGYVYAASFWRSWSEALTARRLLTRGGL